MLDIMIKFMLFTNALLFVIVSCYMFNKMLLPKIIMNMSKEIERNPKWIISRLPYYGFDDIDIILYENKWNTSPYARTTKENKIEIWISNDTTTKEVEAVGRLALAVKLKIRYNLWFPEKPLHWLSVLCYLLDGGNIEILDTFKKNVT